MGLIQPRVVNPYRLTWLMPCNSTTNQIKMVVTTRVMAMMRTMATTTTMSMTLNIDMDMDMCMEIGVARPNKCGPGQTRRVTERCR